MKKGQVFLGTQEVYARGRPMTSGAKKKKLCLIVPNHWAGSYGGAEQQVRLLLSELIAHGDFELIYVTRNASATYVSNGYAIEVIKSNSMVGKYGLFFDTGGLLNILNRVRPDVIYQRIGCSYTGIAAFYAKKNKCKMVWHVSSDVNVLPFHLDKNKSSNVFSRYIEKKMLEYGIRNSTTIIAQTRQQAEALNTHYQRDSRVIPNYQPVTLLPNKRKSPVKILWISNLKPMKRPELFIELARDFSAYSGLEFTMIGRAGNSAWHKNILAKIKDTDHLNYMGEIPQDDVIKVLSEAHILVNTSSYEGFPNTFIQAWAQEIPVISLEVNPDNLFGDHGIGFLSLNYSQLRQDLGRLISDEGLRQKMGKNAREYALKNHSLKNISEIMAILSA